MKKYAFMFVAAAAMCFAACGEKKAPAQEAEVAEIEETAEEVIDSAAIFATIDTVGLDSAAIAEKFAAAVDSVKAAAAAAVEGEEAPAAEEGAEQ